MRETNGEAVSATELLNNLFTCLQSTAAENGGGKPVLGYSVHNHHESKTEEWKNLAKIFSCRYVGVISSDILPTHEQLRWR